MYKCMLYINKTIKFLNTLLYNDLGSFKNLEIDKNKNIISSENITNECYLMLFNTAWS